jgi:outer membrane protein TolC
MTLRDQTELKNTRAKLARMEARYESLRNEMSEDEELREATLNSLKRYINQFKEEIARYEAHHAAQK